jgi:hypothetical protein
MAAQNQADLQSFHAFVAKQLADGSLLSPEEALARWRERADTIAAVRDGLQAVANGRFKPLDTFKNDFESRHDISGK